MVYSAEYIKKKLEQEMILSQAFGRDLVHDSVYCVKYGRLIKDPFTRICTVNLYWHHCSTLLKATLAAYDYGNINCSVCNNLLDKQQQRQFL